MSEKRRGLGRGLGALIPTAPPPAKGAEERPVDVFFAGPAGDGEASESDSAEDGAPEAQAAPKPGPARRTPEVASVVDPVTVEPIQVDPESGEVTGATVAPPKPAAPKPGAPKPRPQVPPVQSRGVTKPEPKPEPMAQQPADEQPADEQPDAGTGEAQSDLLPVPGARFAEIPVGSVTPNPKQPRQVFEEEALAELVHSIREIGVLQPIVVRQLPAQGGEERFELIMGERRLRASKEAGLERIPAIVRDTQDVDMLRDALLENLHRAELNPLEEAAAYQQLLDDFGCTHEELATRIGRSRPQISNTIRLLRLPPAVQRRVAAGVLSAGHARALLGLENADSMDRLAQRIVNEGLSVRATEEAVAVSDGDDNAAVPRRKPRAGGRNVELDDLAGRLADRLDTRVNITLGRSKGKLSVEFASVEDLNRILEILTPGERGAFKTSA